MKLQLLLEDYDFQLVNGTLDKDIYNLAFHSGKVAKNTMFFAIKGHQDDGGKYIEKAIKKGACAAVIEEDSSDIESLSLSGLEDMTLIKVKDVRKALSHISSTFYEKPSEKMFVIGVTGTKGKTSATFMIRHILESAGIKTGIIGTVMQGYTENMCAASDTTPQSLDVQKLLYDMYLAGCKAVVMEVSSQGLKHDRVSDVCFDLGVFTNISPDHIGDDEHRDFEEYLECKKRLFKMCKTAVINMDDSHVTDLLSDIVLEKKIFFGQNIKADYIAENIRLYKYCGLLGTSYILKSKIPDGIIEHNVLLSMPGEFNAYNSLAAISVTRFLNIPWNIIFEALKSIKIPGRAELVEIKKDFSVIVDYAHNGVALENLLKSLRAYKPSRIILVFGCGGNRDRNRRFEMGNVAMEHADYIVVTSDNPRYEDPQEIIDDITGVMDFTQKNIVTIPDRKAAIKWALEEGRAGDIIVIAGKGHETYQIIGDKITHFDDKEMVLTIGKELQ